MRNIFDIAKNILKVNLRNKSNVIFIVFLPVLSIFLTVALSGVSSEKPANIGICNLDTGVLGSDIASFIKKDNNINLVNLKEDKISSALDDSKVACAILIPKNFSESIFDKTFKNIEILALRNQESSFTIKNYLDIYTANLLDISKASDGDRALFNRLYASYKNSSFDFNVNTVSDVSGSKNVAVRSMGWFILFMMFASSVSTSFILNDKKRRTYFRICASPVSSRQYLAANLLANFIIVVTQVLLVIISATMILKLDLFIAAWQLMIILIFLGIAATGLSFLIVSFSKDSIQANTISNLIITPSCMVSGCLWGLDIMPKFMQNAANFFPQKWALGAIQKIQEGSAFSSVAIDLAVMLAFAVTFFMIAAYRFSREDSVRNVV